MNWLEKLTTKNKKNKEAKEVSKFLNSKKTQSDIKRKGYSIKSKKKDSVVWKQEPSLLQKATGKEIKEPLTITSDGNTSKIKKNKKVLWSQK